MAMATNTALAEPSTGPPPFFSPYNQTFTILAADGTTQVPLSVDLMDSIYPQAVASCSNYGSQIGASLMMLLVVLTMTPLARLGRTPIVVSLIALTANMLHKLFLALYYNSHWFEFYTFFSGDVSNVTRADYGISVASVVFGIPVDLLIELALVLQAWSMIKLWAAPYKWSAAALSMLLVVSVATFKTASSVLQTQAILFNNVNLVAVLWVHKVELSLLTASIAWFCSLFIARLAMHMWENRTILPSMRGVSAMEVLVMSNGVLMLIPVVFAGLEFRTFDNFEAGSLTQTSVIVVLPLATLIAQRIANPSTFNKQKAGISAFSAGIGFFRSSNPYGRPTSYTGGSGTIRRPFLRSWGSGGVDGILNDASLTRRVVAPLHACGGSVKSRVTANNYAGPLKKPRIVIDPIDQELAEIDNDATDPEKGSSRSQSGVRVKRSIESHYEQRAEGQDKM